MRIKSFSIFICVLFLIFGAEIILRICMPKLGNDLFRSPGPESKKISSFIYNKNIGYEFKPYTLLENNERLNSEGFRGPDYAIPKPAGIFRILVIGDSVAMSGFPYEQSWEQVLELNLNRFAAGSGISTRYEVINAGIGGYVSWQALKRLEIRGLKYQPDLVLLLVGWNDMLYSALPNWSPEMNLSTIVEAYAKPSNNDVKKGFLNRIRISIYRNLYIARFIREVRNAIWNKWHILDNIQRHQLPSGINFNEKALELYRDNLEKIYKVTGINGIRLGLIVYPTILRNDLLDDPGIHRRLIKFYRFLPQSTGELFYGYGRYKDAQLQFADSHADVILIDAAKPFADKNKDERLILFEDLNHPTAQGCRILADTVLKTLADHNILK